MYGCEVMWPGEKAVAIRKMVEEATGKNCKTDRLCVECPLLRATGVTTLTNQRRRDNPDLR